MWTRRGLSVLRSVEAFKRLERNPPLPHRNSAIIPSRTPTSPAMPTASRSVIHRRLWRTPPIKNRLV